MKRVLVLFVVAACQFGDEITAPHGRVDNRDRRTPLMATVQPTMQCMTNPMQARPCARSFRRADAWARHATSKQTARRHVATSRLPARSTIAAAARQECAAGYTCAGSAPLLWCNRLCQGDANCLETGSRCVNQVHGANTCSNGCNPQSLAGCPSGLGCYAFENPTADYTDCRPPGAMPQDYFCFADTDCRAGHICREGVCKKVCLGNNDCSFSMFCRLTFEVRTTS